MRKEFILYLDKYTRHLELKGLNRKNINRKKSILYKFFKYLEDKKIFSLKETDKSLIRDYQSYIANLTGEDGEIKYRTSSQLNLLTGVKSFYDYLLKHNIVLYNPAGFIKYPKTGKRIIKNILSKKEITNLFRVKIDSAYEFMCKVLFIFLYSTGLRITEALELRVNEINLDEKELKIYDSKRKADRVVLFGDVLRDYLGIYLLQVRGIILGKKENNYLFPSYRGRRLREEIASNYLKYFKEKAGIKKYITAHCFRHSYATHFLQNGVGLKQIATLLGHANLNTTIIYTRVNPIDLRKVINDYHPIERGD